MTESPAKGSPSGPSGGAGKANGSPSHAGGGADPRGSDQKATNMDGASQGPGLARLQRQIERLDEQDDPAWSWNELRYWLRDFRNLKETTVNERIRHLRFMQDYSEERGGPSVNLNGTRVDLWRTFLMYWNYRQDHDDHAGAGALGNDRKAVKALGDFLRMPDNVWPSAPTSPQTEQWVPHPAQVSEILHYDFATPRTYENYLIRYWLWFSFMVGVRPPSELYAARVDDIDLDTGTLLIREPKKGDRRRRVVLEPDRLVDGHRNQSLEKWINHREKCNPKTNALFPKPDGTEFGSSASMAMWIKRRVWAADMEKDTHRKKRGPFEWWKPYVARHWNLSARLIAWDYNFEEVAQFAGHEDTQKVKNRYARDAKALQSAWGDNWIHRALKPPSDDSRSHRNPFATP